MNNYIRCFCYLTLCVLLGFSAFYSAAASAQSIQSDSKGPRAAVEKKLPKDYDYSEIPDEYFDEADAFYDECLGNASYTNYYDCACLSTAYLNTRMIYEDGIDRSGIVLKIRKQCRDASGSVGKIYKDCLGMVNYFSSGTDPEKLCSCTANTYVRTMNRVQPRMNMNSRVTIRADSLNACRRKLNYN